MDKKKFLDSEGISILQKSNNDTLRTVVNIIDQVKQDKITGAPGDFVIIDENGNITTKAIPRAEEATF